MCIRDLKGRLDAMPSKAELPLVLRDFKVPLLIYGPFIEKCSNAWRTLSGHKGEQRINQVNTFFL